MTDSSSTPSPSSSSGLSSSAGSSDRSGSLTSSLGAIPKLKTQIRNVSTLSTSKYYFRSRDLSKSSHISSSASLISTSSLANDSAYSSISGTSSSKRITYRPGYFVKKETVDVFRYMLDMNMTMVIRNIFSYLDDKDLCRVPGVSTSWNACLLLDQEANTRRRNFIQQRKLDLV